MKGVPGWQPGVVLRPWMVAGAFSKGTLLNTGSALTTCSTVNSVGTFPYGHIAQTLRMCFLVPLLERRNADPDLLG